MWYFGENKIKTQLQNCHCPPPSYFPPPLVSTGGLPPPVAPYAAGISLQPLGALCASVRFSPLITLWHQRCQSPTSKFAFFSSAAAAFNRISVEENVHNFNETCSRLKKDMTRDCAGEVLSLFSRMHDNSIPLHDGAVANILRACTGAKVDFHFVEQIHAKIIRFGFCTSPHFCNPLIDFYLKNEFVDSAIQTFKSMGTGDSVTWVAMISGLSQNCREVEAILLYREMRNVGIKFTYNTLISGFAMRGLTEKSVQLFEKMQSESLKPDGCAYRHVYAKHGKLETALKIFRRLNEDDIVSWTAMISGYTQHDMFSEALKLFEEMQERGIRSDNIGLASIVSACAGIQALSQGRQIHSQSIVSGYSSDISIGNALVCLYARCGCVMEAHLLFEKINPRDNVSWNGLISGFAQSGMSEEALKVFSQMIQAGEEANMFTYGSAVSAAANLTKKNLGKQIHARTIKTGYDSETEVCNVLLTLYAKCGCLNDARRVFVDIPQKNEISWNAMITGYSQHGYGRQAIELFEDMKRLQMMPNHITFVGVLTACSHVGLVEEGISYFKSMSEQHGLVPKQEHYACVVDVLGGQVKFAVRDHLWSLCQSNQTQCEASSELEPKDSATYVLMSNMYAVTGKWDYRDRARQLMRDRGVKKEPGRSWIEVRNSFHAFFVGDRLHPLADEIHQYLEDLNERVGAIGYVQDRSSLWNDLELGQKDPTAYIHSEKLAVAFGLLSLPNVIPLHVMKNLRMIPRKESVMFFLESHVDAFAAAIRDGQYELILRALNHVELTHVQTLILQFVFLFLLHVGGLSGLNRLDREIAHEVPSVKKEWLCSDSALGLDQN
ncbi:hypothetical protein DH2020_027473 [Rehmannia glutinosa]|uniref:DYW domain-containing protein n=1 Tax=Rehmannia glutinosa TaxID=99300 RepID=A0ABR0VV16_REHGL